MLIFITILIKVRLIELKKKNCYYVHKDQLILFQKKKKKK